MTEQFQTQPHDHPQQPSYRRLTRAPGGPVSGVCGGVAAYAGIAPLVVRVLTAIAVLVTFPVGAIVYVVLWAVLPRS